MSIDMIDKVSVVIPVYNSGKYVPGCVESVLNQTYGNIEIILVDDCSKDDSLSVCQNLAAIHENIMVVSRFRNGGEVAARSDGMEIATGKWLIFLDSDDVLEADVIQTFIDATVDCNPDIVISGYKTIDQNNIVTEYFANIPEGVYSAEEFTRLLYDKVPENILSCVGSKMYNTYFVQHDKVVTGSEVSLFGDTAFISDALRSCTEVKYINKVCYSYFFHSGSIMYSYKNNLYQLAMRSLSKLKALLVEKDCYDDKKVFFHEKCYSMIWESIRQELHYKHGYKAMKAQVESLASEPSVKDTCSILCNSDISSKDKIKLFLIKHRMSFLLSIIIRISLWKESRMRIN